MTLEGKDEGDEMKMRWWSMLREGGKKQWVDLLYQILRSGPVGPCVEQVLGTCAWGKRGLGGENVCTRCRRATWSTRLTSCCYTRTIYHKIGSAKSPV